MALAPQVPVRTEVAEYPLERANGRSTTCAAVGFAARRCWSHSEHPSGEEG